MGAFIGAGFISGREVAIYFAKFGFWSILFSFIVVLIFYVLIKYALLIGKKYNIDDKNMFIVYNKYTNTVNILTVFASLINIGAMIAGAYSIGKTFGFGNIGYILAASLIIITYLIVKTRFGGLSCINQIFAFTIIVILLSISIITIFKHNDLTLPCTNTLLGFFGGLSNSIIYVLFNMYLLGILMIQIGARYDIKTINRSSIISAILIGVLILFISLSITFSSPNVYNSDVPMLEESIVINNWFAYVFAFCQFIGILTTIVCSTYLASNAFALRIKSYKFSIILSLLIGLLISFIGFYNIVDYLYKLTGVFGLALLVIVWKTLLKDKGKIKSLRLET